MGTRFRDRKHKLENMFLKLGLHMVVMITGIDLSQEISAVNRLRTLKILFEASSDACSANPYKTSQWTASVKRGLTG